MCEPIRSLVHADVVWQWTHEHEEAFSKLKEAISKTPVLRYFDSNEETTLQCDASTLDLAQHSYRGDSQLLMQAER